MIFTYFQEWKKAIRENKTEGCYTKNPLKTDHLRIIELEKLLQEACERISALEKK